MQIPPLAPCIGGFTQKDGATVAKVASLELKRRGGVSIVFTGSGGSYSAVAVENAFFRGQ